MIKKLIAVFSLFVILAVSAVFYIARQLESRQQRQQAKAPQTSITLLEGWDNSDIAAYLQKKGITTAAAFLEKTKSFNTSAYPLLAQNPKNSDLQGFVFPDTYFIPANPLAGEDINQTILKKALDNFSQKITPQMLEQAKENITSLFDVITLASIIEKEAGKNFSDKQLVAGIFYNRLKINMPLQSDATVNFITGKNTTRPSLADIAVDNPYNTYENTGLPPGPICNPSLDSIKAALSPQTSDYLYFITDPKTGAVVPAKTLDGHNKNKAKYLN